MRRLIQECGIQIYIFMYSPAFKSQHLQYLSQINWNGRLQMNQACFCNFRWYFYPEHCRYMVLIIHFFHKLNDFVKKIQIETCYPTYFDSLVKIRGASKTNEQTYFFQISNLQKFQLWYPIIDAITNKICHAKHYETIRFCFFAEKLSFRYAI